MSHSLLAYFLLVVTTLIGFLILFMSQIKTTEIDLKSKVIQIRKTNIFYMMRSITNYPINSLTDIRAVWRGLDEANVHTTHYAVVLEFTHDNVESSGTQDDEFEEVEIEDKFRVKVSNRAQKILEL